MKNEIDENTRVKIQQKLNEIREIRNDFAHNFAQNKKIESRNPKLETISNGQNLNERIRA